MSEAAKAFDFCEMFDAIVDSSANIYEKMIALIIARHVGKDGEAAYPSRARILRKASCSMATFKRSQAALAAFFDAETCKGKSTLYAPKPAVTADEIEAAIALSRADSRYPTDTGSCEHPVSHRAETRYPTELGVGIPESPEKKPGKKPGKKKESSLRSDSTQPGCVSHDEPNDPAWRLWHKCVPWLIERNDKWPNKAAAEQSVRRMVGKWQKKMEPIALLKVIRNAGEKRLTGKSLTAYISGAVEKAASSAKRDEAGRLELVNGFRQEIEGLLKGRDLRMTLDRIGGSIPMHVVGVELETKVRSEVIKLMDIEESWERRGSKPLPAGRRTQEEADRAYLDRLAEKYLDEAAA
jgi:hypothetical protein